MEDDNLIYRKMNKMFTSSNVLSNRRNVFMSTENSGRYKGFSREYVGFMLKLACYVFLELTNWNKGDLSLMKDVLLYRQVDYLFVLFQKKTFFSFQNYDFSLRFLME